MTVKLTIRAIKEQLTTITDEKDAFFATIINDERQGVQKLIQQWRTKKARQQKAQLDLEAHLQFEKEANAAGYQLVAGVDEVGRGPLAGPVVAAAVILPPDFSVLGVNDSKQLSDKKRIELYPQIMANAVAVGFGIINAEIIDQINIYEASLLAMKKAVEALKPMPDYLLIDAMVIDIDLPQVKLIKGDAKSASIGAASIIAKVKRDQIMADYAHIYPGYEFEKNAGYGTKGHLNGLVKYGITPIHRRTFAPVKSL